MSEKDVELVIREIDNLRKDNKSDHEEIKDHVKYTNGTVADLVTWKIQVKTVLYIFGFLIAAVVVPVFVQLISYYIKSFF
jgi:hypothetical protein